MSQQDTDSRYAAGDIGELRAFYRETKRKFPGKHNEFSRKRLEFDPTTSDATELDKIPTACNIEFPECTREGVTFTGLIIRAMLDPEAEVVPR